jgi:hypothetical protein
MLATRSKIRILRQVEVRDAAFLAREDVTGGGKHHSALVIGFMDDLVEN